MMWALIGAAGLTVLIETPILAIAGYRDRLFLTVCVLINLATNLTLNLGLSFSGRWYWYVLYPAECAVVVVEWAVLALVADKGAAVRWRSRSGVRLLFFVFLANLISLLLGLI